jgi:regulator of sirC expression with transglutaminase-like and TPR domain
LQGRLGAGIIPASMKASVLEDFVGTAGRGDLARAALAFARVEYPALEASGYLARLDDMGDALRERLESLNREGRMTPLTRVASVNDYLYGTLGLAGNRLAYHDPRNSCLNDVIDRGLGIPISLGVMYIEVTRRAGFRVEGVNFPGHFLLTCSGDDDAPDLGEPIVIDPFNRGAVMSEQDCRDLLESVSGDDIPFDRSLLAPSPPHDILARMLTNLKRVYVALHSFPQARDVTELLIALDPEDPTQLRDRGLLAYQLRDLVGALRDLQQYLERTADTVSADEKDEDREQIEEYVRTLRKRVADLN